MSLVLVFVLSSFFSGVWGWGGIQKIGPKCFVEGDEWLLT